MRVLCFVVVCLFLPFSAAAGDTMGKTAQAFVKNLQQLLDSDQREAIARQVHYPLTVDGKKSIRNAAAFLKSYDAIFTKAVQQCVKQQDTSVAFEMVKSSYMAGWGCIWFDAFESGTVKIYSVNTKE